MDGEMNRLHGCLYSAQSTSLYCEVKSSLTAGEHHLERVLTLLPPPNYNPNPNISIAVRETTARFFLRRCTSLQELLKCVLTVAWHF